MARSIDARCNARLANSDVHFEQARRDICDLSPQTLIPDPVVVVHAHPDQGSLCPGPRRRACQLDIRPWHRRVENQNGEIIAIGNTNIFGVNDAANDAIVNEVAIQCASIVMSQSLGTVMSNVVLRDDECRRVGRAETSSIVPFRFSYFA